MKKILVVDDDPIILETLQECLYDEGYRVATALSVDAALPLLRADRYSLVLTDALVQLRDDRPDYWAAIEQIRSAAGTSPVAILSAHTADRFAGFEARGFAALIRKPFEIDEFCATVRRIIDRGRTQPSHN